MAKVKNVASDSAVETEVYNTDTSDEEELRNHVGNIPLDWYDDFSHFGYTIKGQKIVRNQKDEGTNIDEFLRKQNDPNYWKKLEDKITGKTYTLEEDDLKLLESIDSVHYPDLNYNPYEKYVDWFTGDVEVMPISLQPESKKSFMPSVTERKKIIKLVKAIRSGRIKFDKTPKDQSENLYLMWDSQSSGANDELTKSMKWRNSMNWRAPKLPPPASSESYNPPKHLLPTKDEVSNWENKSEDEKVGKFLPTSYGSLRHVPAYEYYLREKFERCLDLYLCPRQKKMKVTVDPESLVPKLPSLEDLQPFPSMETTSYYGHKCGVTSLSVNCTGEYLCSGDSSGLLIIWNVTYGRRIMEIALSDCDSINCAAWSPIQEQNLLLAVACGNKVHIIVPLNISSEKECMKSIKSVCEKKRVIEGINMSEYARNVEWSHYSVKEASSSSMTYGIITISHEDKVVKLDWHSAGSYLLCVCQNTNNSRYHVITHNIFKKQSQTPFNKSRPHIQDAKFHPFKPIIFIASRHKVAVFHLQKQTLLKTFVSGLKCISCLFIHPTGDNFVVGSYDKKLCWFDMDLSLKPYKTLKYNKKAITDIKIHKTYPLTAASSEDSSCTVLHTKVYNDLMKDALILPLKQLRQKNITNMTACEFHPHNPWVFVAGENGDIWLFT